MILVDQPYLWPGTCILTGQGGPESGPYVDLETEDASGARRYITCQAVVEMTKLVGGGSPQEMAAARETTERLEAVEAELEATTLKLQLLEAAVATTLSVGAVFDRKTTKPKLRKAPAGTLLALKDSDDVAA